MFSTLLALISIPSFPSVAGSQLKALGYELDEHVIARRGSNTYDYTLQSQLRKQMFNVSIHRDGHAISPEQLAKFLHDSMQLALKPTEQQWLDWIPSKLPFTEKARLCPDPGFSYLHASSGLASISIRMPFSGRKAVGGTVFEGFDPEFHPQLLENLGRWLLAELTAQRMTRSSATLDGVSYTSWKHPKGEQHIRAREWAQRAGYTLNVNLPQARAYLSGARGTILIPFASTKVKVNDQWFSIPGVTAIDGPEPLIPVRAIQRLSQ